MIGLESIASYIAEDRESNYDLKEKFDLDNHFIHEKLGVDARAIKSSTEKASDLCVKAFNNLQVSPEGIDCCIVVTQNPDYQIPHTSAIVQSKLNLPQSCACFDISLGCSGYVYGLSVIISFMKSNNFKKGLLFTSDPYSEIIDSNDKNTALLFGDAATVSLISDTPKYAPLDFVFGTNGDHYSELICREKLFMNGRAVFAFTATQIPKQIKELLDKNKLTLEEIDKYILHQGSKYIVDTITKRLGVEPNKVTFEMFDYGNTVSSSIPIILSKELTTLEAEKIVLSGFGVGLSWASTILYKI